MTDPKKSEGPGAPPVTVGAIGLTARKIFPKTLAPQPVPIAEPPVPDEDAAEAKPIQPAAGQEAAPAPVPTMNLSDADTGARLESNPPPTHSGHVLDAHAAAGNGATLSAGTRRRLQVRKSVVFAVAGGMGAVALVLAARTLVHRKSASAPSAAPAAPTAVPVPSMSPSSAPDTVAATADSVAATANSIAATADSVPAPPGGPPSAAAAPAKHRAPRTRKRPVSPKSGPAKIPQ